ncbi:hypothetical protein N431DRAFT_471766 [Stipitochalara longipes BDJ]|nr:hypothetical protein N431DRAFT_471766 [Stipitochalara longipes BDJ]
MQHELYPEEPSYDNLEEQVNDDLLQQDSLYDSYDDQPSIMDLLVHDGEVYQRTAISRHQLLCSNVPYVETEVAQAIYDDEEEDEAQQEGPNYLIFNNEIYEKYEMEPWEIDDMVTRVTTTTATPYRKPSLTQSAANAGSRTPLPSRTPADARAGLDPYRRQGPANVSRNRTNAIAAGPMVYCLPYGFDLDEYERSQRSFTPPNPNNSYSSKLRRVHWAKEHLSYLWSLIDLGLRHANRPLEYRDFGPITEALHRHFQGTFIAPGISYPIRGSHAVHSYIMKTRLAEYERRERSILGAGSN